MFNTETTIAWVHVIAALIAGKWALELGCGQARQLLWMIVGLVCPPLALLVLYVRLIRQRSVDRRLSSAM